MVEKKYDKFVNDFGSRLYRINLKNNYTDYIFMCIGTDKVVGDSFGPRVGDMLNNIIEDERKNGLSIRVYGTLYNQINYLNIQETIKSINNKHKNPCIITIDAALTKGDNIGDIIVNWGGIEVGKGLNKNIYCNSDINIKGVVGKNMKDIKKNIRILKTIQSSLIQQLSSIVSNGINEVIEYI